MTTRTTLAAILVAAVTWSAVPAAADTITIEWTLQCFDDGPAITVHTDTTLDGATWQVKGYPVRPLIDGDTQTGLDPNADAWWIHAMTAYGQIIAKGDVRNQCPPPTTTTTVNAVPTLTAAVQCDPNGTVYIDVTVTAVGAWSLLADDVVIATGTDTATFNVAWPDTAGFDILDLWVVAGSNTSNTVQLHLLACPPPTTEAPPSSVTTTTTTITSPSTPASTTTTTPTTTPPTTTIRPPDTSSTAPTTTAPPTTTTSSSGSDTSPTTSLSDSVPPATPTNPPAELPYTGLDEAALVIAAAVLITLGAGLVRRRHQI